MEPSSATIELGVEKKHTVKKAPVNYSKVISMAFSGDGTFAAIGTIAGKVYVWETHAEEPIIYWTDRLHDQEVSALSLSSHGNWLVSVSRDGEVKLSILEKDETDNEYTVSATTTWLTSYEVGVKSVVFSAEDTWLGTTSAGGKVGIRDPNKNWTFQSNKFQFDVTCISISTLPLVAAGQSNGPVQLLDFSKNPWILLQTIGCPTGVPMSLRFSAHGLLALGSAAGMGLLDVGMQASTTYMRSMAKYDYLQKVSPNGLFYTYLKADAANATSQMWLGTRLWVNPDTTFLQLTEAYISEFSPRSDAVAFSNAQSDIEIWDIQSDGVSKLRSSLSGFSGTLTNLAFSTNSNEKFAAATLLESKGSKIYHLYVWKLGCSNSEGKPQKYLLHEQVWALAFSPNNEMIAIAFVSGLKVLWNCRTGQKTKGEMARMWTSKNPRMIFSPNSLGFVTWEPDIHIWDTLTGSLLHVLDDTALHPKGVASVAFSPDGDKIATIGEDSPHVRLWNILTGAWDRDFRTKGRVSKITFSEKGDLIAREYRYSAEASWEDANSYVETVWNLSQTRLYPEFAPTYMVQFSKENDMAIASRRFGQPIVYVPTPSAEGGTSYDYVRPNRPALALGRGDDDHEVMIGLTDGTIVFANFRQ